MRAVLFLDLRAGGPLVALPCYRRYFYQILRYYLGRKICFKKHFGRGNGRYSQQAGLLAV